MKARYLQVLLQEVGPFEFLLHLVLGGDTLQNVFEVRQLFPVH